MPSQAPDPADADVARELIARLQAQHITDQGTIDTLHAGGLVDRDAITNLEAIGLVDRAMIAQLELEGIIDRDKIINLEVALVSARRIGAAMGIVMALQKVTEEQAFSVLRDASQRTNRKLRDVADVVLTTGTSSDLPEKRRGRA